MPGIAAGRSKIAVDWHRISKCNDPAAYFGGANDPDGSGCLDPKNYWCFACRN
jgi:hypothetical protein